MLALYVIAELGCCSFVFYKFFFHETFLSSGDLAPEFSLYDQDGVMHSLSSYRGKTVALCFYPKDDSPGCTKQMCSLRDGFEELSKAGIVVLGVSYDRGSKHKEFASKYRLSFSLLADRGQEVAKKYGVDRWLFAQRVTFLINGDGRIKQVINKVDVGHAAEQILHELNK